MFTLVFSSTAQALACLNTVNNVDIDGIISSLRVILWRTTIARQDRIFCLDLIDGNRNDEISSFLKLLEKFNEEPRVIALLFQLMLSRLINPHPCPVCILVDSGIEKVARPLLTKFDDCHVKYFGGEFMKYLEKARKEMALEKLRFLGLAFEHQIPVSVVRTLLHDTAADLTKPPSTDIISKEIESLLNIIEDCDDQEDVIQIALNLLISCDESYIRCIDPSRVFRIFFNILCTHHTCNWRVHAVIIRISKILSIVDSVTLSTAVFEALVSKISHQSQTQLILWTISSLINENFGQELLTLIPDQMSQRLSISDLSSNNAVIPANLEHFLISKLKVTASCPNPHNTIARVDDFKYHKNDPKYGNVDEIVSWGEPGLF